MDGFSRLQEGRELIIGWELALRILKVVRIGHVEDWLKILGLIGIGNLFIHRGEDRIVLKIMPKTANLPTLTFDISVNILCFLTE